MKKRCKIMLLGFMISMSSFSFSQLEFIGQFRVRSEYLDGYKQPLEKSEDPGFFISQRARLGLQYTHSQFQFNFTAQDIRVWGSTSTISVDNKGLLSIFEANASIFFTKKWSLKLGRQAIQYDNGRIFGMSDWGMPARRHDAAILKFEDSTWRVDVGAAYNQASSSTQKSFYELNNYKTFQYAWAQKEWKGLTMSLLFVNNGIEQIYFQDSVKKSRTNFTQTFGTYLEWKRKKFELVGYGYYQMGFNRNNQTLHAFNTSLLASYTPIKPLMFTLGGEVLSGTSQEATLKDRSSSFSTHYNSNHPLNGYMDYFYAGNHQESVGLINAFFKISYVYENLAFAIDNHLFFAAASVQSLDVPIGSDFTRSNPYLGYEMDFTIKYQFIDEVAIQAGYSLLAGTESLRVLKGSNNKALSHWAYVMLTLHPFKNLKLKR